MFLIFGRRGVMMIVVALSDKWFKNVILWELLIRHVKQPISFVVL